MNWYYANAGQQAGPVSEAELEQLVGNGVVRADTLVWREGMPAWQPYSAARAATPASLPAAASPVPAVRYGGFWIRFVAHIIDSIILGAVGGILLVPMFLLMSGMGAAWSDNPSPDAFAAFFPLMFGGFGLLILIGAGVHLAYEVYFLSTRGATPGKMVLGLKVVRAGGGPVSAGLAAGRFFAEILTGMTLTIGYIIAGFDTEKRALHDHICGTRVIYA
jgi:uncharacterized RDD family membrane protein YckC